eukprot:3700215-Lingulodinium_polyedra.AAC.1
MRGALAVAVSSRQLPPAYFENPVVREHGSVEHPVLHSLTDSVLGFWVMNIITQSRVLFCVVRKKLA